VRAPGYPAHHAQSTSCTSASIQGAASRRWPGPSGGSRRSDEDDRKRLRVDARDARAPQCAIGVELLGVDPVVNDRNALAGNRGIRAGGCRLGIAPDTANDRVACSSPRAARRSTRVRSRRRAAPPSRDGAARGLCTVATCGDPVDELGEMPAEVRVPGVAVDEGLAPRRRPHREVDRDSRRAARCGGAPASASTALRDDRGLPLGGPRRAPGGARSPGGDARAPARGTRRAPRRLP